MLAGVKWLFMLGKIGITAEGKEKKKKSVCGVVAGCLLRHGLK